ncbi:MAG: carboxypeptidase regulatory-like domain-containing protein, partial [Planctomycetaceae bacterium]|nr:carboxypeptidase regulatory-like domain-containing protein [Planctomycetaceae bacterium]
PRGKGGALLFEASLGDWSPQFDVRGIRGSKHLHAYLYDAGERILLDDWGMDLLMDDIPPETPQLVVPSEIGPEVARLPAKAIVTPPSSGIRQVAFLLNPGAKGDFAKAEAENKTTPGKASQSEPDTWEASLPVPPGAAGTVVVSVKVTSGVGLSAVAHEEVWIREPAPQPPAADTKPAPPKPGAIEGVVTENDIKQPGLDVILYDPEAKAKEDVIKATTRTAADGSYSFAKVEPGKYSLFCIKQATNRSDTRKVTVSPGQTVRQDLDLLLH